MRSWRNGLRQKQLRVGVAGQQFLFLQTCSLVSRLGDQSEDVQIAEPGLSLPTPLPLVPWLPYRKRQARAARLEIRARSHTDLYRCSTRHRQSIQFPDSGPAYVPGNGAAEGHAWAGEA